MDQEEKTRLKAYLTRLQIMLVEIKKHYPDHPSFDAEKDKEMIIAAKLGDMLVITDFLLRGVDNEQYLVRE